MAGTARMKYPPNVRLIRLMCSGRLDPTFVFKAFAGGADGVLVSGCHPGECHYIEQNYKAMRRFHLMRRTLQLGIEPGAHSNCSGPPPRKAPGLPMRSPSSSKRCVPSVRLNWGKNDNVPAIDRTGDIQTEEVHA